MDQTEDPKCGTCSACRPSHRPAGSWKWECDAHEGQYYVHEDGKACALWPDGKGGQNKS